MNTWLLVLMISTGSASGVKYVEFATKAACDAAAAIIDEKSKVGWRPVCIEGGKPIPETSGIKGDAK